MKKFISIFMIFLIITLSGCTENSSARSYGGTMTLYLEPNTKLEEITWKDESLWYLTKPMKSDDIAEIHTFQENTGFGILEGTVIIVESKATNEEVKEYHLWQEQYSMDYHEYLEYKKEGYTIDDFKYDMLVTDATEYNQE